MKARAATLIMTILAMLAAAGVAAAPAAASPESPTTGDRLLYIFESDVHENSGAYWFDGNNEIDSLTEAVLPDYDADRGRWLGAVRVTSASTYQAVAATFQTLGHYAACRVYVNSELVGQDWATGQYAVASC